MIKLKHDVSLALSGSGFKFPVHVGVIASAEELGKTVVEIAGSSGGALVGGLYACGVPVSVIKDFSMNTKWMKYLQPSFSAIKHGGFLGLDLFTEELKRLTGGKKFRDLNYGVDLVITASDLLSHTTVEFSREKTPDVEVYMAIRASISIPVLFTPVKLDGLLLTDGALFNYLPINLLKNDEVNRAGMKVTYRGIFHPNHIKWPWTTGVQSAYGAIDRGNSWAVDHFAKCENIYIANMQTGFANGLDPFISMENRHRLYEVGRESMRDAAHRMSLY